MLAVPVVDISHHDGPAVDFAAMEAGGVRGVVIRLGDDLSSRPASDRHWRRNFTAAATTGLALGAYAYVRDHLMRAGIVHRRDPVATATGHAAGFREAEQLAGRPLTLGFWPDLEEAPRFAGIADWVDAYYAALDQQLGVVCGRYGGAEWFDRHIGPGHEHRLDWLARYSRGYDPAPLPSEWWSWIEPYPYPRLPAGAVRGPVMWQFSSSGPGLQLGTSRPHALDCNLADEAWFAHVTAGAPAPTPQEPPVAVPSPAPLGPVRVRPGSAEASLMAAYPDLFGQRDVVYDRSVTGLVVGDVTFTGADRYDTLRRALSGVA